MRLAADLFPEVALTSRFDDVLRFRRESASLLTAFLDLVRFDWPGLGFGGVGLLFGGDSATAADLRSFLAGSAFAFRAF